MTIVKRLRLLTAALGGAAALAVVGTTVLGDIRADRSGAATPAAPPAPAVDTLARTKFTDQPALTYQLPTGEVAFALQLKPALPAAAARPRDVLVMVDTSASQAGPSLRKAKGILAALAKAAGPDDRLDVWTVNINSPTATRSLTNGFQPAAGDAVTAAAARLADVEYGAGAVDLKAGLEQAVKQFERRGGRAQVLVYLGDGESAASPTPVTEPVRVELGSLLADREVTFFGVPLGVRINGHNLHGLAAMTGGAVVRPQDELIGPNARDTFAKKLNEAFDVPVFRPERVTFGPQGVEVFPTRLPPIRADKATLVVGTLKGPAATVSARIEGRANGSKVTLEVSEKLPAPATENYFVAAMVSQWKDAPAKDAPAVLAADRTLAMASEQFRLFRDEFLTQAVWAVTAERLDHAEKLFQAAAKIDPANGDVQSGLKVVARVRGGEIKADRVKLMTGAGAKLGPALGALSKEASQVNAQAPPAAQPPAAGQPGAAERDLVAQARAAQGVVEQEFRVIVDETLRRSRRLLTTDPDSAYEELKQQRASVESNDQLSAEFRRRLVQDLDAAMAEVQLKGAQIKRDLASQRERIATARQRLTEFEKQQSQEKATAARVASFKELMQVARFELAQQEAQVMIQERVSRGQTVPPEAHAAYRIGQSATNLREAHELKRLREDRYLLSMMQTEKSFIPYPDEPPVHFPPAAVWRELTAGRQEKYGPYSLGENAPREFKRMRSILEGEADTKRVPLKNLGALSLDAMLSQLTAEFSPDIRFVYRTDLFPPDFKPGEVKLKTPNDLSGLPLGAFLDAVLRDIEMSWIARPEYIEIGPNNVTASLRYQEKTTKVFDVAELIVGIPQSVNPATLYSSIQFQGQFLTIFGSSFVPQFGINGNGLQFQGGLGAGGAQGGFGQGGGAFGAGLGAQGGFGQAGGMFGAAGMAGGGLGGVQGGQGVAGGAGFAGVQGGLAGQFGIQGNDNSVDLIRLIVNTVASREWNAGLLRIFSPEELTEMEGTIANQDRNSIGYYIPAKAMLIRGSHRYHQSPSFKLQRRDAAMGAGGPGLPGRDPVAAAPKAGNPRKDERFALREGTKDWVTEVAKAYGKDADKLWNAAFDKGITDPSVAIDAADILFELKEYAHAAEALKAALRKGRVSGTWAHDALAVALESGQAAPAEVERAALSAIDLDPTDAKAYLRAARTESDLGRHEIALAFCQRAAALEPNAPTAYANALVYADKANDVQSDVVHWASTNLLRRDWPADGMDYHAETKTRVGRIAQKFTAAGRVADADKLTTAAGNEKTRDLVIELLFQGIKADLDLSVTEPGGSTCSATTKRTTGGGVLMSDVLEQGADRAEVYTAAQAFAGTYTARVKTVLGPATGNRATLKVTKYQGTDRQVIELHSIDMSSPQPVAITLESGTRSEMAVVPVEASNAQMETTRAPAGGFGGGAGGGTDRFTGAGGSKADLAVVNQTLEAPVPGIAAGVPGLRLEQRVSADRKSMVMTANPVFTGAAVDVPLPKMTLLPGSGR